MRNRPDHKIDELFQEAFRDFNPEPPGNVWNKIKDSVATDSNSRKKGFWVRNRLIFSIAAAFIIAAGFSSIYMDDIFPSNAKGDMFSENSVTVSNHNRPLSKTEENFLNEVSPENNTNSLAFVLPANTNSKVSEPSNTVKNYYPDISKNGYDEKTPENTKSVTIPEPEKVETVLVEEKVKQNTELVEDIINMPIVENIPIDKTINSVPEIKAVENTVFTAEENFPEIKVMVNEKDQLSIVETDLTNLPIAEKKEEVSHNFNAYFNENKSSNPEIAENKIDTAIIPDIILPIKKAKNYTPSRFAIGLHYTAENLYQLSNSKYLTDRSFRMGGSSWEVSLNFRLNNKISLGTGIGYTSYSENVYFNVDGEKTTIIDSLYNGSEWEYITETETVSYREMLTNNYSFIRLPLFLRYKIVENNRFSLHFTGGGIFSQVMDKREKVLQLPNDITISSTERVTPFQSNYSFLLVTGLNLHYQVSNFVTLGTDLMFKRNITNYYETGGTIMKTPYSVGIRGSVYFNL